MHGSGPRILLLFTLRPKEELPPLVLLSIACFAPSKPIGFLWNGNDVIPQKRNRSATGCYLRIIVRAAARFPPYCFCVRGYHSDGQHFSEIVWYYRRHHFSTCTWARAGSYLHGSRSVLSIFRSCGLLLRIWAGFDQTEVLGGHDAPIVKKHAGFDKQLVASPPFRPVPTKLTSFVQRCHRLSWAGQS